MVERQVPLGPAPPVPRGGEDPHGDAPTPAAPTRAQWSVTVQATVLILGRKWVGPVVRELASGPKRAFELELRIPGITHKVLAETLHLLERDGIAERILQRDHAVPSMPYALTDTGKYLVKVFDAIAGWGQAHLPAVRQAQALYDELHDAPRPPD